jgi:hypothetical protein
MKLRVLLTALLSGLSILQLTAQTVAVSGSWAKTAVSSDILLPGDNYPVYESASNQVLVSITAGNTVAWSCSIKKTDLTWRSEMVLQVHRTGTGSALAGGTVSGGDAYQTVTGVFTQLFTCTKGSVTNIPIQYRLTGCSAIAPAGTYTLTITFTVTAL